MCIFHFDGAVIVVPQPPARRPPPLMSTYFTWRVDATSACVMFKKIEVSYSSTPALTYLSHLLDANTVTSFAKHLCSRENPGKWTIHPSIHPHPSHTSPSLQPKSSKRTFVDVFRGKSQRDASLFENCQYFQDILLNSKFQPQNVGETHQQELFP